MRKVANRKDTNGKEKNGQSEDNRKTAVDEKKAIKIISTMIEAPDYQLRGQMALSNLCGIIAKITNELSAQYGREVVNQVSSRIKTADSIYRKLLRKKYPMELNSVVKLNDLLGVRINCLFLDDVYVVAEKLKQQENVKIIKAKDYIKEPKKTGYRSLHLIVEVAADPNKEMDPVRVEIQVRTVAMDCWSVLDRQLLYKKNIKGAGSVAKELRDYSRTIEKLDGRMMKMRKKIEKLSAR